MKEPTKSVRTERAILVALILPDNSRDFDDLVELEALAETAGARVIDRLMQKRPRVEPKYYIGKGKVSSLAELIEQKDVEVVIFDNDLTPAQIRNLEEAVNCKVIDRSELILDIFATHAKTHQARMQVELAQLQYTYPRLTKMWSHLERIAAAAGGGVGAVGGIGARGPGEKQLETDRRIVRRNITRLKKQLTQIDQRKMREVDSRRDQFTIGLVGYTNAGKSTLMNALTDAGVYVEDKLFATLDTRTRQWKLGDGLNALLSDTVGFIRKLPHHLIASFRATLEEAINADLLLHIVDASNPLADRHVETVNGVLNDLGCNEKNIVTVLNKIDLVKDESMLQVLKTHMPTALTVSAYTGQGLDALTERARWYYLKPALHLTLDVQPEAGKLISFLQKHAQVNDTQYIDGQARMEVTISADWLGALRQFAGQFKLISSSDEQVHAAL